MSLHASSAADASPRTAVAPAQQPATPARPQPEFQSALGMRRQPFLYLAAALIIGILLDRWLLLPRPIILTLAATSIALSARFIFVKKAAPATLALLASLTVVGAWLSLAERQSPQVSRLKRLFEERAITPDDPVELT